MRTIKKGKKGKKWLLSQQRGALWPPRSSTALPALSPALFNDQTVPEVSPQMFMASPPIESNNGDQDVGHPNHGLTHSAPDPQDQGEAHGQKLSPPPRPNRHPAGLESPTFDEAATVYDRPTHSASYHQDHGEAHGQVSPPPPHLERLAAEPDWPTFNEAATVCEGTAFTQPHDENDIPMRSPSPLPSQYPTKQPRYVESGLPGVSELHQLPENPSLPPPTRRAMNFEQSVQEEHPPRSPRKNRDASQHQTGESRGGTPVVSYHPTQSQQVDPAVNYAQPYTEQDTVTLHEVSQRDVAVRIGKPLKKKRVANGPQPTIASIIRARTLPMVSGFEGQLERLLVAYRTQKDQETQDHTTTINHLGQVNTLLQDQIMLQNVTIQEWKNKHETLQESVSQVREKAKTNQKYVTGLQKDYEKLQKSAVRLQEDCEKALQKKIAEVESEKNALQQSLEATLNALTTGHRSLKKTVDDFYVSIIISESKRKDLAEDLSKRTTMYEQEKGKRENLEKQLLSSIQSVQRQLGDGSTTLNEKLAVMQTSMENVAARDGQDSAVQECLAVLQKLQNTSFLTPKDVRKAEGMLRFVHDR